MERKDTFLFYKFDEVPPEAGNGERLAKIALAVIMAIGFYLLQSALGCDSLGDYTLVWSGLVAVWIFLHGCVTVAGSQSFFEKEDRMKRYMLARFTQLLRIELVVGALAVIFYAVEFLRQG